MSYQSRMLIRDQELRWPTVLVAAIITGAIPLLGTGMLYVAIRQPYVNPNAVPSLERALRPGDSEFNRFRKQISIEHLMCTEKVDPLGDLAMNLSAIVRNSTGRTITGLELRGMIVDSQNSAVVERTVVIIPVRQTALEPDEAINVRILLEGINPDSERAHMLLEVAALRFD